MINIKNLVVGLFMLVSGFVVYVIKEKLHSKTDKPLMSVLISRKKLTSYCIGVRILIRVSVTASVK